MKKSKIISVLVLLTVLIVSIIVIFSNLKTLSNVCINGKCGYVNKYNSTIIPFVFTDAKPFELGAGVVQYKGYYGAMSKSGKNIVPFRYAHLKPLKKDKFLACLFLDENGAPKNCGLIDKKENNIVPFKYFDIKIKNNKILVKDNINSEYKEFKN